MRNYAHGELLVEKVGASAFLLENLVICSVSCSFLLLLFSILKFILKLDKHQKSPEDFSLIWKLFPWIIWNMIACHELKSDVGFYLTSG